MDNIKINILNRIKAIEDYVKIKNIPDLIMIFYNWNKKSWCINEKYFNFNVKEEKKYKKHYKEYAIPCDYAGTILLDLYDCPEDMQCGLFSFNVFDIKKKCHIKNNETFKIENIIKEGKKEARMNITIIC